MTIRGTLVLAATLLALVAYLLATQPPPVQTGDGGSRLTPSLERATAIEIERNGEPLRLVRDDRAWTESRASDVLAGLESLQVVTVIDPAPANAALYGFGADAVRLRVLAGTDVLLALEVGATNPAETGVYVRRIGEPPVLLVGALLRWELEKLRRVTSTTAQP